MYVKKGVTLSIYTWCRSVYIYNRCHNGVFNEYANRLPQLTTVSSASEKENEQLQENGTMPSGWRWKRCGSTEVARETTSTTYSCSGISADSRCASTPSSTSVEFGTMLCR